MEGNSIVSLLFISFFSFRWRWQNSEVGVVSGWMPESGWGGGDGILCRLLTVSAIAFDAWL